MSIGNLKDSGNQGNNFPWQLKMLLGQQCACDELAAINDNTDQVEFLLSAILTALQDSNEYEAKFVVDTCDVARTVYLEVRIWDPTPPPGSWGPITYYLPGSSTPVVPPGAGTPGCLQYMDPTGILGMIYNVLNTRLDVNLSTRASESTLSTLNAKFVSGTDIGDVTINNAGGAAAVNIQDGGNSITVDANNLDIRDLVFATDKVDVSNSTIALDVTTLTALENITVQNGAGAAAVNIQDGGNTITVDAAGLDIRVLDCATDSVSICAGGTPITSTTIVGATGLDVNIIQTNVPNVLNSLEQTGVLGDLSSFGPNITSISFASVGTAAALVSVDGGATYFPVASGTTINLSADGPTGFYSGTSFFWDTLTNVGSSLIIIYNYI